MYCSYENCRFISTCFHLRQKYVFVSWSPSMHYLDKCTINTNRLQQLHVLLICAWLIFHCHISICRYWLYCPIICGNMIHCVFKTTFFICVDVLLFACKAFCRKSADQKNNSTIWLMLCNVRTSHDSILH